MVQLSGFRHREVVRRLRRLGFELARQAAGSHEIWQNKGTGRITTISKHLSKHPGDMPEGTLKAILKQADVSTEEFLHK
jgi:predicted RNA binding protein YcfA (HicA-like mRNA interferase family)